MAKFRVVNAETSEEANIFDDVKLAIAFARQQVAETQQHHFILKTETAICWDSRLGSK